MSACTRNMSPGWESTQTELTKTKKALEAIRCIIRCVPAPGSPDYKPNDPEYQALRAQAFSTLEVFSQFLHTPASVGQVWEVEDIFDLLREHGEKAGLLSPSLIGAMSAYLDAYKEAYGELHRYLKLKEEWITTLA